MNKRQLEAFLGVEKLLNPTTLRNNLLIASLYLTAHHILRNSIIEHLRGFFSDGFDQNGINEGPTYKVKVLSRHKSPLKASLLWFREMNVVVDEDFDLVDRLIQHRNEIAHDLPKFIASNEAEIDVQLLESTIDLVGKIDRWWVRNIEITTNLDFDDQDIAAIDDNEIMSGNMLFLYLLLQTACDNEANAKARYEDFLSTLEKRLNDAQEPSGVAKGD